MGRGQIVLQIISLSTLVDVVRVPKARTSGKYLPIDINFICIRSAEKSHLKGVIFMMKNRKNFPFCRSVELDFQHLAGPKNVSVDLNYDVLESGEVTA